MKEFYEPAEVAERLGCSVRQVQRLARTGQIPHVRRGKLIRVPVVAWESYIASQSSRALASMQEATLADA